MSQLGPGSSLEVALTPQIVSRINSFASLFATLFIHVPIHWTSHMHRISIRRPRHLLSALFGLRKLEPPGKYLSAAETKDRKQLQSPHRALTKPSRLRGTNCRSERHDQYCFNSNPSPTPPSLSIKQRKYNFSVRAIEQRP